MYWSGTGIRIRNLSRTITSGQNWYSTITWCGVNNETSLLSINTTLLLNPPFDCQRLKLSSFRLLKY